MPISSGNTSGEPGRWDRVVVTTMGESLQGCLFRGFESHQSRRFFSVFFSFSNLPYCIAGTSQSIYSYRHCLLSVSSSHTGVNKSIVLAIKCTHQLVTSFFAQLKITDLHLYVCIVSFMYPCAEDLRQRKILNDFPWYLGHRLRWLSWFERCPRIGWAWVTVCGGIG